MREGVESEFLHLKILGSSYKEPVRSPRDIERSDYDRRVELVFLTQNQFSKVAIKCFEAMKFPLEECTQKSKNLKITRNNFETSWKNCSLTA